MFPLYDFIWFKYIEKKLKNLGFSQPRKCDVTSYAVSEKKIQKTSKPVFFWKINIKWIKKNIKTMC